MTIFFALVAAFVLFVSATTFLWLEHLDSGCVVGAKAPNGHSGFYAAVPGDEKRLSRSSLTYAYIPEVFELEMLPSASGATVGPRFELPWRTHLADFFDEESGLVHCWTPITTVTDGRSGDKLARFGDEGRGVARLLRLPATCTLILVNLLMALWLHRAQVEPETIAMSYKSLFEDGQRWRAATARCLLAIFLIHDVRSPFTSPGFLMDRFAHGTTFAHSVFHTTIYGTYASMLWRSLTWVKPWSLCSAQ